ncbi:MAG: phage minor capsid protein [Clostridia bacterium]
MPLTPNALETRARALLNLYAEAECAMLRRISRRVIRGADASNWAERKYAEVRAMREELAQIVRALESGAGRLRGALLSEGYDLGATTFSQDAVRMGLTRNRLTAPIPQVQRLVELQDEMDGRMSGYHGRILREACDGYRQVIGETVTLAATGVMTTREAVARSMDGFAAKGISGFWDKSGRRWGMAEYAEMATRTGMMNAALAGYTGDALAHGEDLVIITDHSDECPLCRPWENRVLSLTGAMRAHPDCTGTMDEARAAGLFHPNCAHGFSVYVPGLTIRGGGDRQTPEQNAIGYANRQKLREMERTVRKWKRRQAAAPYPEAERTAKAHVDQWQKRIRAHVEASGIPRGVGREGGRVLLSKGALNRGPLTILPNGRIMNATDSQIGKKLGRHALEWGLDPASPADRDRFRGITRGIVRGATERRRVEWLPDPKTHRRTVAVTAYIKGEDVVLIDDQGNYVTTMKGGLHNKRVQSGKVVP